MKPAKKRPDGTAALSFRLPLALIERIDAQAEKELRNRVNMVTKLLLEALAAREEKK